MSRRPGAALKAIHTWLAASDLPTLYGLGVSRDGHPVALVGWSRNPEADEHTGTVPGRPDYRVVLYHPVRGQ